ncbi:MAG: EAL domain-containing response regulator [Gammaproteobacteria bacterium]|nr:EAL domain-containing response regulator [Gammaproteobacteria bacterium]
MAYRKRLLVLDDERDIAEFVRDVAIESGYDALASNSSAAFPSVYSSDIDVVVLDLMMPGTDGIEIIRFLAECGSNTSVILISGYNAGVLHSAQELASEHGLHVIGSLTKPIRYEELEQLLATVPALLPMRRLSDTGRLEKPGIDEFIAAIDNGEIVPYFQPQLDIASQTLIGVEALVRWEHPYRGLLPAGLILELAHEADLLVELSTCVLNQSLTQCRKWLEEGLKTLVSINMSADIFKDLGLPTMLEEQLQMHRLDPGQITLEVTESALMQELVKSLDTLTRLRMKGIALSIDDFGTGYSSLVQLHRIPFSEMKIDRSFVVNALTDEEALAIVKITIMLGHELGMKVIAEGIENRQTWDLLATLGCDAAQGYFIAKPMPGDALSAWAQSHRTLH